LAESQLKDIKPGDRTFEIEGKTLGYPAKFQDAFSAVGLFVVPLSAAEEMISGSGFELAPVAPGKAMFTLSCVDYRESDCGAYREIAMAFFVKHYWRSNKIPYLGTWLDIVRDKANTFVWKLSVTSRLANDAGILMWGLPKTIEKIDFELSDGRANFSLSMDDQEVLSYSVRAQGKRSQPRGASPVYSIYENAPHVTYLAHDYKDMGVRLGDGCLTLGSHPVARKLLGLGLPRRPVISSWIGRLSLDVDAPEKL
ncbi:MAG: hypothetical protein GY850_17870, partial [bacterium]|nr:hypothetical protein [bacterium]